MEAAHALEVPSERKEELLEAIQKLEAILGEPIFFPLEPLGPYFGPVPKVSNIYSKEGVLTDRCICYNLIKLKE